MLIQSYVSGQRNKHAEVHKDSSGDFSVKHFEGGSHVRTIDAPDSGMAHNIAKKYVSEGDTWYNKDVDPKEFHVVHTETNKVVGKAKTMRRARTIRDKKDLAHGSYVHAIRPVYEDAPTNSAGSGGVAGIGVGPQGEPGVKKSKIMKILRRRKVSS